MKAPSEELALSLQPETLNHLFVNSGSCIMAAVEVGGGHSGFGNSLKLRDARSGGQAWGIRSMYVAYAGLLLTLC